MRIYDIVIRISRQLSVTSEMINVPYLNLKQAYQDREEIIDAVARVYDSGWYILGENVSAFEIGRAHV